MIDEQAQLERHQVMEVRDLQYIEASAIEGNFTRAAKVLGINASTIAAGWDVSKTSSV